MRLVLAFLPPLVAGFGIVPVDVLPLDLLDVIVVGAGMSGLTAAETLLDAGVSNLVVLEGSERIGGRMEQSELNGYKVELGASFVHGNLRLSDPSAGHFLQPLIDDVGGLEGARVDYTSLGWYDKDGEVAEDAWAYWLHEADSALLKCEEWAEMMWSQDEEPGPELDISLRQCFINQGFFDSLEEGGGHEGEEDLAYQAEFLVAEFEFAEPSTNVSTLMGLPVHPDFDSVDPNRDYLTRDPDGYQSIIVERAAAFSDKIQFNKVVETIDYSNNGYVAVTLADGSTMNAKYVIFTGSLGVLQGNSEQLFKPSISGSDREAGIQGMHFSNYAQLYLAFEEAFWTDDVTEEFLIFLDQAPGNYSFAVNDGHEKFGARPILDFHLSDKFALKMETQPLATTTAEAMQVIKDNFPGAPETTGAIASDWSQNPLVQGAYSDWPVGYDFEHWKAMCDPIRIGDRDRVRFGGEHCDQYYFGFLHGAMLVGQREANALLNSMALAPGEQEPEPDSDEAYDRYEYDFLRRRRRRRR